MMTDLIVNNTGKTSRQIKIIDHYYKDPYNEISFKTYTYISYQYRSTPETLLFDLYSIYR